MTYLATYDPEWKQRWARAQKRFESLSATAPAQMRQAALEALHLAHDAQFQTVDELAGFRFDHLKKLAFREGFLLAMRPLSPEATGEEVDAQWREADHALKAAKRARDRPPIIAPEGLKAFTGPGCRRRTIRFTYSGPGAPQDWAALIEKTSREVHVCLAALDERGSVFNDFAGLATAFYVGRLRPPLGSWAGPLLRRVHFYSYRPWALHETGAELFHARVLAWRRGRFIESFAERRAFATVPPALAELDPEPRSPHLVWALDRDLAVAEAPI